VAVCAAVSPSFAAVIALLWCLECVLRGVAFFALFFASGNQREFPAFFLHFLFPIACIPLELVVVSHYHTTERSDSSFSKKMMPPLSGAAVAVAAGLPRPGDTEAGGNERESSQVCSVRAIMQPPHRRS